MGVSFRGVAFGGQSPLAGERSGPSGAGPKRRGRGRFFFSGRVRPGRIVGHGDRHVLRPLGKQVWSRYADKDFQLPHWATLAGLVLIVAGLLDQQKGARART